MPIGLDVSRQEQPRWLVVRGRFNVGFKMDRIVIICLVATQTEIEIELRNTGRRNQHGDQQGNHRMF